MSLFRSKLSAVFSSVRASFLGDKQKLLVRGACNDKQMHQLGRAACNDNDKQMLLVEHVHKGTREYSVISAEKDSLNLVRDNLPDFSFLRTENYNFIHQIADYHIIDSCNKWCLLSCERVPEGPWEFLWDPTTGETKPIPHSLVVPGMLPDPLNVGINPAIGDDEVVYHLVGYGMGFDPVSGDYKVVRTHQLDYIAYLEAYAEVYSTRTGCWKEVKQPLDPELGYYSHVSVRTNGTNHFLAHDRVGYVAYSFDFLKEEFSSFLITLPKGDKIGNLETAELLLGEFHGSLACIIYNFKHNGKPGWSPLFEIWVWNGSTWSCEATHAPKSPGIYPLSRVVGLYMNDKALLLDANDGLVYYNCATRHSEYLGIHDDSGLMRVFPYVQSCSTP